MFIPSVARAGSVAAVIGIVLVLLAIFVVGPVVLFVIGAGWAAINGYLQSEDADKRANSQTPASE